MRFEYKYIVREELLDDIRHMVIPFVNSDSNNRNEENGYTVRSIYFDTPRLDYYYEKVEGIKNRKKFRIRGYNKGSDDTRVYLEIKRKYNIPILKNRIPLTYGEALELFRKASINGFVFMQDDVPLARKNASSFFFELFGQNLRPVILVMYEREAFFSKFDRSVRITFDRNLRSKSFPGVDQLFDNTGIKRAINGHFILEVKFDHQYPSWLRPLLSRFDLRAQAASKYVICIDSQRIAKNAGRSTILMHSTWFAEK
ncbi:MAG: polyphosphate polymerase domain-containing protein [Bacteroidales bacterium]|nr:polyphosphate polymerase domain-containing protein [Bacteroidales bacterium]